MVHRLNWRRGSVSLLRPFVVGLIVISGLVGCGDSTTSEEYVARAEDYLAKDDRAAAAIELQNAIQKDPNNGDARLKLGELHLQFARYQAAEKELSRARELGIESAKLVGPLSRAWNSLGEYQKTLDEFPLNNGKPVDHVSNGYAAGLDIAHGWAHAGLGEIIAATRNFEAALAEDPDNVQALIGLGRLALAKGDLAQAQGYLDRAVAAAANDADVLAFRGDLALAAEKPEEAIASYQVLYDIVPQNPVYELALARAQLAANENDQAIVHLDALLKRAKDHPDVNFLRAVAAYRNQDFETAKKASDTVLAVSNRHMPSLLIAGASAFALGQYEQAADRLEVYVHAIPSNDRARRLYGSALMRLGVNERAREVLEPLAQTSANDPGLLQAIATAAMLSGDLRSGAKYFEQVASLRPDDPAVRAQIGVINVSLGEDEQGIEDLESAVKADPTLDRAQIQLVLTYLKRKEFDKAIAAAERLQETFPENPAGSTLVGIAQLGKGDTQAAKAAFHRALKIRPGAPDASGNLAALELREGNTDQALTILKEALEKNPGHVRTVLRVAQLESQSGKSEQAKQRLKIFMDGHPEELAPRLALAQLYLRDKEPQKALDVIEGQLVQHPGNAAVMVVVGQARLEAGRPADAADVLRRLVEAKPDSADAHFLLARAYLASGDQGGYRTELEKTLKLDPDRLPAKFQLANLAAQQGDMTTAKRLIGDLKQAAPEDPNVVELEGAIAIRENRPADAVKLFEQAVKMRPHENVVLKLAEAQRRAGDLNGSQATLEKWVSDHPEDLRVRTDLGNLQLTQKQFAAAKQQFTVIVNNDPENVLALNNLAWLLWHDGDAQGALPHAERAVQLAPGAAPVMDTAGIIHLTLGNTSRALSLLSGAAAKLPENVEVQYHYAQALAAQGDDDQARDVLSSALAKGTDFSERGHAEALLKQLGG